MDTQHNTTGSDAVTDTPSAEATLRSYKIGASGLTVEQCTKWLEWMNWDVEFLDMTNDEALFAVRQTFTLKGLREFVAEQQVIGNLAANDVDRGRPEVTHESP